MCVCGFEQEWSIRVSIIYGGWQQVFRVSESKSYYLILLPVDAGDSIWDFLPAKRMLSHRAIVFPLNHSPYALGGLICGTSTLTILPVSEIFV